MKVGVYLNALQATDALADSDQNVDLAIVRSGACTIVYVRLDASIGFLADQPQALYFQEVGYQERLVPGKSVDELITALQETDDDISIVCDMRPKTGK